MKSFPEGRYPAAGEHGSGPAVGALARVGFAALLAAGILLAPVRPADSAEPTFESHWQDGRAELDGYRYTVTRYGMRRRGTAVLIYVTEPMSESKRVKVDDPLGNPADTFEALKVNFVRDFQTGIYDYNTMTSLFVRSRDLSPAKIAFTSAEWCGQVYEEMLFERHHVADRYASYFEGESALRRVTLQDGGLTEEELFAKLRDLRGPWLKAGERRAVPFLPGAFWRRLAHRPLLWTGALLTRSRAFERVVVPAGSFEASVVTVSVRDGREGRFWIERAYPHRVLKWEWSVSGAGTPRGRGFGPSEGLDQGELTGSARLAYWTLNGPEGERYRKQIGIPNEAAP